MKNTNQFDIQKTLYERGLGENTLPAQYLDWLLPMLDTKVSKEHEDETEKKPFLSVIMRTQGKRFESLKEALLCLEAQSDNDFEIILVVHNADADGKATVDSLLAMQSPAFLQKIRKRELDGGTRTAPLNLGASLARGTYFAMLDDDDLIFDNWVEVYHKAAKEHTGRVIRCYGCTQYWSCSEQKDGAQLLKADSGIQNQFCSPFDLTAQLEDNHTPISCVAIPSFCYHKLGLCFDESLTTAEDWDYIMRCVLTVGVFDTEELTFLYRLWNNGESSRTLHEQEEWTRNRLAICKKLDAFPILTTRKALLNHRQGTSGASAPFNTAVSPAPHSLFGLCKQIGKLIKRFLIFRLKFKKNLDILRTSALFDAKWYLENNPDVAKEGLDPYRHYLTHGWYEGRDPSKKFSTARYLTRYPDIAAASLCPLLHYETAGKYEGREID